MPCEFDIFLEGTNVTFVVCWRPAQPAEMTARLAQESSKSGQYTLGWRYQSGSGIGDSMHHGTYLPVGACDDSGLKNRLHSPAPPQSPTTRAAALA